MKALLDYIPLIIFFYFYKTTDPLDRTHPLLEFIGSKGAPDNNNILVATCALLISTLIVYGCLLVFQKFKLQNYKISLIYRLLNHFNHYALRLFLFIMMVSSLKTLPKNHLFVSNLAKVHSIISPFLKVKRKLKISTIDLLTLIL